jgi:hypothetical protein
VSFSCSNNGPLCSPSNVYKYYRYFTSTSTSPLLCTPRMRSRPVLHSLPSTVVAFCRSLKLKTMFKALVRHPRRARKSINEQQVIPPNTHGNLTVEMDGKYDRPVTEETDPNQQFPTTTDNTSNKPFDSEMGQFRSLPEVDKPAFWGERPHSATSGVCSSPFRPFYTFAQVNLYPGLFWWQNHQKRSRLQCSELG